MNQQSFPLEDDVLMLVHRGWVQEGDRWVSPYFGSAMPAPEALRLEASIRRLQLPVKQ